MQIIGLAGYSGSGKSTVANILFDQHGFTRRAFALPVKQAAQLIYSLTDDQVFGSLGAKETIDPRYGLTPRFIMQRLGTEVGRSIHPDTWVLAMHRWILAQQMNTDIVIDDVRFPNEVAAIYKWGGQVFQVVRPGVGPTGNHKSEQPEQLGLKRYILNDGTLTHLENRIRRLVAMITDDAIYQQGG